MFTDKGIRYVPKSRSRFLDALVSKKGNVGKSGSATHQPPSQKAQQHIPSSRVRPQNDSSVPFTRSLSTASTANRNTLPYNRSKSAMPLNRNLSATNTAYRNKPAHNIPSTTVSTPQKRMGTSEVYTRHFPKIVSTTDRQVDLQPAERLRTRKRVPDSEKPKKVVPRTIDPSWFFPIGSKVMHKQLGEGMVLPAHITDQKSEKLDVLVRFGSGEERYFPLHGSDISPIV